MDPYNYQIFIQYMIKSEFMYIWQDSYFLMIKSYTRMITPGLYISPACIEHGPKDSSFSSHLKKFIINALHIGPDFYL